MPFSDVALNDVIADLVGLDVRELRLQWRNHLGGTPPAHLPRWLLLRILAYRIQVPARGGLDKDTLRLLRQPKGETLTSSDGRPFQARIPTTPEGANLTAGALLTREWNGKLERVIFLEDGFAWNGGTYGSLSQVAKAMTGTNWNGHRFFGLRTADRATKAASRRPGTPPEVRSTEPIRGPKPRCRTRFRGSSTEDTVVGPTARRHNGGEEASP
jgi:hypothetical protein